jgi:tetratricopeptide (TPR) repeat protein
MIRMLAAAGALALLGASPLPSAAPPAEPTARTGPEAHAHWAVPSADPQAQALVDRGLAMLYAFDVGEARVAFGQAVQRAPDLALAYWGLAEADTIDINLPSTPEGEKRGAEAAAKGRAHLANASPDERALVEAIAKRYGPGSQAQKFGRYADALSAYTKTHRDDPNLLAVAAYAIYNAEDALVDGKDALTPKARETLADLDRALELDPTNLGAHHLRVHLLEYAYRSKDAVPDAEALSSYSYPLGESHLPHMAGHIWARIGDYARLAADNIRAVRNDEGWFAQGDGPGQQYMRRYHDHCVDFVLYGLTTVGRDDEARAAAKNEDAAMRVELALRLHDDAAVLAAAAPSAHAERALAAARAGDLAAARAERAKAGTGRSDRVVLALADAVLARKAGSSAQAAAAYGRAYDEVKSGFTGDPKNYWYVAVGEGYGAALLADKRPAEAETVFAAELKRYPNDPHLEFGLAEALRAQGKDDAAPRAAARAHWKGKADLTLAQLG